MEALSTAVEGDISEVGYRLRKRSAALLSTWLPGIEKDLKELYKQRSAFVHGSFFTRIYKETKTVKNWSNLPSPPFESLYRQKEHVRIALVAYLYLHSVFQADRAGFVGCDNVSQILERAIIDIGLRNQWKSTWRPSSNCSRHTFMSRK